MESRRAKRSLSYLVDRRREVFGVKEGVEEVEGVETEKLVVLRDVSIVVLGVLFFLETKSKGGKEEL